MESTLEKSKLIPAAVLVPIFSKHRHSKLNTKNQIEVDPRSEVLFTVRSQKVEHHKGQISFPGGMKDSVDASLLDTALRESHEEVGIPPTSVKILAELPSFPTIRTPFIVHPFIGQINEELSLSPNQDEIDEIFFVPINHLFNPINRSLETIERGGVHFQTHVFTFEKHRIWGATAYILDFFIKKCILI